METDWERYLQVSQSATAISWLEGLVFRGRSTNTLDTYARGLEDYLSFCAERGLHPNTVTQLDIDAYVRQMIVRPNSRWAKKVAAEVRTGLILRVIKQRLSVVRQFCDYLVEEGVRTNNPIHRNRCRYISVPGDINLRWIRPYYTWIPTEDEWSRLLWAVSEDSLRNRVMFALVYDGELRGRELCSLEPTDIDVPRRLIRIRSQTSRNRRERVLRYSEATSTQLNRYLQERAKLGFPGGPLFLSESNHKKGHAISRWTLSRVVAGIAERARVPRFSEKTLRYMCGEDFFPGDLSIEEHATIIGHPSLESMLPYIHVFRGREIAAEPGGTAEQIDIERVKMTLDQFIHQDLLKDEPPC